MKKEEISRVESEVGIIATLIRHPDFCFYSEDLLPNHFVVREHRCMYLALCNLAQKGIREIDAFMVLEVLRADDRTRKYADDITDEMLNEYLSSSTILGKDDVQEYRFFVDNVIEASLRRDLLTALEKCESMCYSNQNGDISDDIYKILDNVMLDFSSNTEVTPYREMIDQCWDEIKNKRVGIPFKFPALNEYTTILPGELFIFGAEQKQGKSIMLLNCTVDLLQKDYSVLYLDSELNTRSFTERILAHLTGISFRKLVSGDYNNEEEKKISKAIEWLKTRKFTHVYIPMFDQQSIYTTIKKVNHTQGLDVLVVDYFKGKGEGDAFESYQELGRLVDMIKNQICGDMNIAGIGAAQATATGKLADSAKIARNASTIAMLSDKTPDEIAEDGEDCGNKKLRVVYNRNGEQQTTDEYIDLMFDGNHILYEQAKRQHSIKQPF